MPRFFIYPFAVAGDKSIIPDPSVPSGSVSYEAGFTSNYQLVYGVDPNALAFPRYGFNGLMYDITTNIQQYQTNGIPEFVTAADNGGVPYPYSIYSLVQYNPGTGKQIYCSLVNGNDTLPTDTTKWQLIGVIPSSYAMLAKVSRAANQPLLAGTHLLQYDTPEFDDFSLFTGAPDYKITPGRVGYWAFYGLCESSAVGGNTGFVMDLYKNGVVVDNFSKENISAGNSDTSGGYTELYVGSATDYFQAYISTSISLTVGGNSQGNYFGARFIGLKTP